MIFPSRIFLGRGLSETKLVGSGAKQTEPRERMKCDTAAIKFSRRNRTQSSL